DANNHSDVIDLGTINLYNPFSATVASTNPTINGGTDGTITVTAQGGKLPYEYSYDNGVNWSAVHSKSDCSQGSYAVKVKDANGSEQDLGTVTLADPGALAANVSKTDPTIFNGTDGTITVSNQNGGSGTYEYSYDGGSNWETGSTKTDLSANSYSVQMRDANNKTDVVLLGVIVLVTPNNLTAEVEWEQPSFDGASDGEISIINPSGAAIGTIYKVSIDGGVNWTTDLLFSNLAEGTYQVMLRVNDEAESKVILQEVILVNPATLTAQVTHTNVSLVGGNDGSITILSPSGGKDGVVYEYSFDGGATWQKELKKENLAIGSYEVMMRVEGEAASEVSLSEIVIEYTGSLTAELIVVDPSEYGKSDGEIHIANATGGAGVYEFSINNGNEWMLVPDFNDLPAGSYEVMVCMQGKAETITKIGTVKLTNPPFAEIQCDNNVLNCRNTTITLNGASCTDGNGTSNIAYLWGTGETTSSIQIDEAGTYSLTVKDLATNKEASYSVEISEDKTTPNVNIVTSADAFDCNNEIIVLEATVSGSNETNYEYQWSNGQTTSTIEITEAGEFTVNVVNTDSYCESGATVTIGKVAPLNIEVVEVHNVSCFDGEDGNIITNITGGKKPYQIEWSSEAQEQSEILQGLKAGSYHLLVTDALGCSAEVDVKIEKPLLPSISVTVDPINCYGYDDGRINLSYVKEKSAAGYGEDEGQLLNNYEFSIDGGNSWLKQLNFEDLEPGVYDIFLRYQESGCTSFIKQVELVEPEELAFESEIQHSISTKVVDGSIALSVEGGTGPYTYIWNTGDTQAGLNEVPAGDYTVEITDANGCLVEGRFTIQNLIELISAEKLLTPNGDGINDVFVIEDIDRFPDNELIVFNRLGVKVFSMKRYDNSWAATSGSNAIGGKGTIPPGTYYYLLVLEKGQKPYKGFIEVNY
ncbi:T9SS type B sorting domain-containing protein, partial [Prolixibacteraceae bacterium JC049]|nr:T9SS type B sorting domain-containing protein [Prolixibacteraceae bacterium JC049]